MPDDRFLHGIELEPVDSFEILPAPASSQVGFRIKLQGQALTTVSVRIYQRPSGDRLVLMTARRDEAITVTHGEGTADEILAALANPAYTEPGRAYTLVERFPLDGNLPGLSTSRVVSAIPPSGIDMAIGQERELWVALPNGFIAAPGDVDLASATLVEEQHYSMTMAYAVGERSMGTNLFLTAGIFRFGADSSDVWTLAITGDTVGNLTGTAGEAATHELVTDKATLHFSLYCPEPCTITLPDLSTVEVDAGSVWSADVALDPGDQTITFTMREADVVLDTTRIVWSMAGVEVEEGETATFHVIRTDGGTAQGISIFTDDGTAEAGVDFDGVSLSDIIAGTEDITVPVQTTLRAGEQPDRYADLVVEIDP